MKVWTILISALLAACASTPPGNDDAIAEQLRLQADAWDRAIVAKDRAAIATNMATGFRQIGSDGRVADRDQFLDAITSERLVIDPYGVTDFDVRLYGDTALLTGRTLMSGRYDGRPFTSHYRYTDVYVRDAGVWKVVSVQTTEVRE